LSSRELLANGFAQREARAWASCWIILGLIAGFIGSKIVNREGQGFWLDIALGIVGALVGGFLFDALGATGTAICAVMSGNTTILLVLSS
jgi:uncharacterized membrane protein YeaQ/YmgE (transglycosylase-associated protein family)